MRTMASLIVGACLAACGNGSGDDKGGGKGADPRIGTCAEAGRDAAWWLVGGMLGPEGSDSAAAYGEFWRATHQTAERSIHDKAKALCGRLRPASARCIGSRTLNDPACENPAMELRTIVVSGPACVEVARAALPVRWLANDAGGPGKLSPDAPWATQAEALRARIDGEALTAACSSGLSFGCLYLGRGSECAALDASLRPKP